MACKFLKACFPDVYHIYRYLTPPHRIRANHEKKLYQPNCVPALFKIRPYNVLFVQRLDWKSLCNHLITKYLINYLMMLMLCNRYIGGKSELTD